MANAVDPGNIDGSSRRPQQPTQRTVFVSLRPALDRFLVVRQAVAVAARPGSIPVNDLERTGRPPGFLLLEKRRIDVGPERPGELRRQHGVVGRQERSDPLSVGKDEVIRAAAKRAGKFIQAAFPKKNIAIGEPNPIRIRPESRFVPSDGPAEKRGFGKSPPIPPDPWRRMPIKTFQDPHGIAIRGGVVNGYGQLQCLRGEADHRIQLMGQKRSVVPAMADDFEAQGTFRRRLGCCRRQTGKKPPGGHMSARGHAQSDPDERIGPTRLGFGSGRHKTTVPRPRAPRNPRMVCHRSRRSSPALGN